jgi:hypothetical protein
LVAEQRASNQNQPSQHEIDDLDAQKSMALWAKLMFFATLAATAVTGFGVWLVRLTLKETKYALGDFLNADGLGRILEAQKINRTKSVTSG